MEHYYPRTSDYQAEADLATDTFLDVIEANKALAEAGVDEENN